MSIFAPLDTFARRHIGPNETQRKEMLKTVGLESLDHLEKEIVPSQIRLNRPLNIPAGGRGEAEVLAELKSIASQNKVSRSFIGQGYYNTHTPFVILRNITENPGWYTSYTPYQAEISQGRMESLLNFQTMVGDLTGLPYANASLLDESTAAAEALSMTHAATDTERNAYFVADDVHPQTLAVVKGRAEPLGIKVHVGRPEKFDFKANPVCGALIQYPNTYGIVEDYAAFTKRVHDSGALVVCATDLLALTLLKPPGEFGADIAVGSAQRFGVPVGYGGPHAAFLTTGDARLQRKMPGRIIGVSRDSRGQPALRMALQTREQHIRREKATSNICTAQALLANMAAMYGVYHGPEGLRKIATRTHQIAGVLREAVKTLGHDVSSSPFFDTLHVFLRGTTSAKVQEEAAKRNVNLRVIDAQRVGISMDETVTERDVNDIVAALTPAGATAPKVSSKPVSSPIPANLQRKTPFMTNPVFNSHHSEHEMLRYIHKLETKDLALNTSMIALGSCTMKLNATAEMIPVTWPEFNSIHPFAPVQQAKGYMRMFNEVEKALAEVTGFHSVTLQPNAGSAGEYTGLLVIRADLKSIKQDHRTVCLIPTSAHGTNPASAVMAGFKVVPVKCNEENGYIDVADLQLKAAQHKENLAAIMVTYPSTYGVFEEHIKDVCNIVHLNGGQVYMDGANMNAQVGVCRPGDIGADVCHLNLHKTFCIPHGGGGPGVGPIGVAKHLAPFLPSHPTVPTGTPASTAIEPVSAAPWGSSSIVPITWMYITMMGAEGLKDSTLMASLNANYMKKRLQSAYKVAFTSKKGFVAHEFIVDLREFKERAGVEAEDVAKRLMDYGFHAPTMSWPVAGTLMIEPTESEPKGELDRFVDAMLAIRAEIQEVIDGKADRKLNVLKGAPHTADMLLSDKWDRPYSREKAAYPLQYVRNQKFWPTVGRLDNVYGDKNLICSCPSDWAEKH